MIKEAVVIDVLLAVLTNKVINLVASQTAFGSKNSEQWASR
jgi:hypothetical protein